MLNFKINLKIDSLILREINIKEEGVKIRKRVINYAYQETKHIRI